MHRVPWFWRLHRVHHLDTELDVSSTVRFHPLEFAAALLIGIPLVLGFGLTLWILLLYELLDAGVTLFSHANVRLPAPVEWNWESRRSATEGPTGYCGCSPRRRYG